MADTGDLLSIYHDMSARKRRAPKDAQAANDGDGSDLEPTTGSYTEATSLLFDPN